MTPRLHALVDRLTALGPELDRPRVAALLTTAGVRREDVDAFVAPSEVGYARRRVARTEHFELLVLTWRPGQGSAAHDHGGSLCGLAVLEGRARETRYAEALDGLVEPHAVGELTAGEVLVDESGEIHALENPDASALLVSLHVYAPPLPELRRFAVRDGSPPLPVFTRTPAPSAPRIAIVGGGFSGTMVAANLLRLARGPLHVTLFDRQPAFGEGPAYRTADPRHLLNVPASNMSAWPDRPAHFLEWARARDPSVTASTFVPRRTYGEYVRAAFFEAAAGAGEHASVELLRREVLRADRAGTSFWLHDDRGEVTRADVLVVTTGHRPPSDPLRGRWSGSRARYVEDPWSSLALSAIAQDEPVLLLGTGLTAIDVLLTLTRDPRTAPITAVSRRGLVPAAHVLPMPPRVDPRWIEPLLEAGPTARGLISSLRRTVRAIEREGGDWRSVVDGLRAITPRVWASLGETEARRWLRHVRPFWEVHRHRAAPEVARSFEAMRARGELRVIAGRARAASGDVDGVWVELEARGGARREERFAWVVNCTGPGAGVPPFVESLAQNGLVRLDPLGLGLVTDDAGRAVTERGARDDLLVVGTLRKPALWESTAVPELRVQAAQVARAALWALGDPASFD